MTKYVYLFKEGEASMRNLLGGKGANLAEMTNLGLPVPQGFIVTTEACTNYYDNNKTLDEKIVDQIFEAVKATEEITNKKFGDSSNPLLLSVRSGARVSMPGMMNTVLNLGLNDVTVKGLASLTNNERFAYDCYRRFIQMFCDVVMGIDTEHFEELLEAKREKAGVEVDSDLSAENLKELVEEYKALVEKESGAPFLQDPKEQLLKAVLAVFESWNTPRAITYRRLNDIPGDWGTAVNVQSMVFGNMGPTSGTGVSFTRNPSNGENVIYGEYLMNAQGEDVVAGIRTPLPIAHLEQQNPEVYKEFVEVSHKLENHYCDMQDMEFTIENGKLYILQTRNGKRTASAALKIAVDLVNEGLITKEKAIMMIDAKALDTMLHPMFDPEALANATPIASGLPASPGAACGKVYFSAADAVEAKEKGEKVVLVRIETSPDDIEGMHVAEGILTARGGMTSHAAVVARGMGTCCVAGSSEIIIDYSKKEMRAGDVLIKEGDYISIDGTAGKVYAGEIKTIKPQVTGDFSTMMNWADEARTLGVRINADTIADASQGLEFGAEGIGLCRTEHMFFQEDRIRAMREMILSETEEQRKVALAKLLPMQRADFAGLFRTMGELPVTIRLLDPPLHEFLPTKEEEIVELSGIMDVSVARLKEVIDSLHEFNPMLGHRGCRLDVTYPEIAAMQTKAIVEAAVMVKEDTGVEIKPEIMVPLVGEIKELKYVKDIIVAAAEEVLTQKGVRVDYVIGTMIEIPRAALLADEIATEADFFSFGTNDLTQMTFGFSRDDAGKFLNDYYNKNIYENDPFARIDQKGVGKLMEMATQLGRKTKPNLKLGICGEHGGEQTSVIFCHKLGLSYVSCSPYRVPIAKLSAAQAAIADKNK